MDLSNRSIDFFEIIFGFYNLCDDKKIVQLILKMDPLIFLKISTYVTTSKIVQLILKMDLLICLDIFIIKNTIERSLSAFFASHFYQECDHHKFLFIDFQNFSNIWILFLTNTWQRYFPSGFGNLMAFTLHF